MVMVIFSHRLNYVDVGVAVWTLVHTTLEGAKVLNQNTVLKWMITAVNPILSNLVLPLILNFVNDHSTSLTFMDSLLLH